MPKTIRCRRCKQMFEYEGGIPESCPACTKLISEWKDRVRLIVWQHPGITAAEVHLKTEVPFAAIMQMIKSGDLLVVPSKPGERERALDALKVMQEKASPIKEVSDIPLEVNTEPLPEANPEANDDELLNFHIRI